MVNSEGHKWFALRVRSRHEKSVTQTLECKGFQVFLPLYTSRNRWADRLKYVSLPLFPGYVFCRFKPGSASSILSTSGVVDVVGFGNQPVPIDDHEIHQLQRLVETNLNYQPCPYLKVGQRVQIREGPLSGVEGILQQIKSGARVVLSVELLQRSVAVEIDGNLVLAVHGRAANRGVAGLGGSARVSSGGELTA